MTDLEKRNWIRVTLEQLNENQRGARIRKNNNNYEGRFTFYRDLIGEIGKIKETLQEPMSDEDSIKVELINENGHNEIWHFWESEVEMIEPLIGAVMEAQNEK